MATKNPKPEAGKPFGRICQVALIFIILAFLFFRSFLPQYVHFNSPNLAYCSNPAVLSKESKLQ